MQGQALIEEDCCGIWIIVFRELKGVDYCTEWTNHTEAYMRRSGRQYFHPERSSRPLLSCPVSRVRFVPGADITDTDTTSKWITRQPGGDISGRQSIGNILM